MSSAATDTIPMLLQVLRSQLDLVWADDTAYPGTIREVPSAGHCAVVAFIIWKLFGGRMISRKIEGVSHWYNRIDLPASKTETQTIEVDLTGDQFGFVKLGISRPNHALYGESKIRSERDLSTETTSRAILLASRIGINLSAIWS